MPLRLRQLIAYLLVLLLMPGWGELLENLEHLAHDGHLAHVLDHEGDDEVVSHEVLEAEHGCTPMQHSCACHVSIPGLLADAAIERAELAVQLATVDPGSIDQRLVSRANAPPVRPPIA